MKPINLNTQYPNTTQVCSSPRFGKRQGGQISGMVFDALGALFPPNAMFEQTVIRAGENEIRVLTPIDSPKTESAKHSKRTLSLLA